VGEREGLGLHLPKRKGGKNYEEGKMYLEGLTVIRRERGGSRATEKGKSPSEHRGARHRNHGGGESWD